MPSAMRTNIGLSRIQNEDCAWYDADKGIFAVADGMGGHLAGEVASAMAIEAVRKMAEGAKRASFPQLRDAFAAANADILKHAETHAECSGMGTTLSVLWLSGDRAYLAHTGRRLTQTSAQTPPALFLICLVLHGERGYNHSITANERNRRYA